MYTIFAPISSLFRNERKEDTVLIKHGPVLGHLVMSRSLVDVPYIVGCLCSAQHDFLRSLAAEDQS